MTEYCAQHAPDGMIQVNSRACRIEMCGKCASLGVAGTKTAEYGAQDARGGMVNFRSRKCRTEGCGKIPSFGVAVLWSSSTPSRFLTAVVSLEGDQARFG